MTETAIDLQPFCAASGFHVAKLGRPFSRGDYTYATEGHILIRVPRRANVGEIENSPEMERIFPSPAAAEFRPINAVTLPALAKVECMKCEGRGTEHDCPDCECECEDCDGAGAINGDRKTSLSIGGAIIGMRYARLLLALPALEVAKPNGAVLEFRFDGGVGLVALLGSELSTHLDIAL